MEALHWEYRRQRNADGEEHAHWRDRIPSTALLAATVWMAVFLPAQSPAASVGFGAGVAGDCGGYDLSNGGPVYSLCYSAGGPGITAAVGSGAFGPGFGGGPNFSNADLSTGSLSATASWSTMNFSTNGGNLSSYVGTTAGATLMDTVTFANVTPGAMATLTLDVGLSMTTNGLLEGTDALIVLAAR